MITLGINLSHHSSIALLDNNEVLLFLHEERVNRSKYYRGIPYRSLDLIKSYTKHIDNILLVSGSKNHLSTIVDYLKNQEITIGQYQVDNTLHHAAHAAAGFYMSHFNQATIVVIDGAGAMYTLTKSGIRVSETTSIYSGTFPTITCTDKLFVIGLYDKRPLQYTEYNKNRFRKMFPGIRVGITEAHDIGWKYAKVTSQIGFGVFGEGKTMGLSAYRDTNIKTKKAYEIQKELESSFLSIASKVKDTNLVLSGGCALNILGNSLIKKTYPKLNIFIDPIAADGTVALGAAAISYYTTSKDINKLVFSSYQGPLYSIEKNYIYECVRKYSI